MSPCRILAIALSLAALALTPPAAFAQDALILDVPPGTWFPLSAPEGQIHLRVLQGEVTLSGAGRVTIHHTGALSIEPSGDVYAAGNLTATDARVAVTFIPAPAQPPRAQPWTGDANTLLP